MEERLEFQVEIGSKELRNFSLNHTYKSFSGVFGLLFSGAMLIAAVYFYGKVETSYFVLLLLMGGLFTVWNPLLLSYKAYKQGKSPVFKEPLLYSFSEAGMEIRQNDQQGACSWAEMRRIVNNKKAYFIYMSQLRAYILPKNQMDGKEQQFIEMAAAHLPAGKRKGLAGGTK